MAIYRFRVVLEDHDDFFRDIEIKSKQSFEDLHNEIQKTMNFDNKHMASFYICDADWNKRTEISLVDMSEGADETLLTMKNVPISRYMDDPHQKIIYVFDFLKLWTFYIELLKILPLDPNVKNEYPRISKQQGNPPPQYLTNTGVMGAKEDIFIEEIAFEDNLTDDEDFDPDIEEQDMETSEDFNEFI